MTARASIRTAGGWSARWLACAVVVAVLSVPYASERAIEQASFDDRIGTLPVEVGLAHNGFTSLDTGLLGTVYWRHTATAGFGAAVRSTGPPVAGGTLASYVSPAFVRANTRFLEDPQESAAVYGAELRHQVVVRTVRTSLSLGIVGATLLVLGWSLAAERSRRFRLAGACLAVAITGAGSCAAAVVAFRSWEGNQPVGPGYPLPGAAGLSFSSEQTREVAEQIRPFIEKNTARIRERTDRFEDAAVASIGQELDAHGATLDPRDGEIVVLAEADPQGSMVGTRVRHALYAALDEHLPPGSLVLRTIAGDVSSNGTVAERRFVDDEVSASPRVPVVAAKGDHDTQVTVEQLLDAGATVPDTEVVSAGGLRVASARDPAFKALFGGLVVNDSGITEADAGAALRGVVDEDQDRVGASAAAYDVVLHQPRAAAGYLGQDLDDVREVASSLTHPVDDGIPDLPPGIITYGHLHDPGGPWVVWNTDGDEITWTVITQLGTSGGVEENPTFNRFSTPFSAPLKTLSVQLQYVSADTGLQTGLVPVSIATDGTTTIGDRIDVGLPGGRPGARIAGSPETPYISSSARMSTLLFGR